MSKDKIEVNMNIYDIPIVVEQLEKANAEIERLNNIINEIEAIIYNNQITGIEARLEIQERLDKLQELKGSDKE